ncbi:equilibrative nucleoside transporter 4-like isoform X8 [Paramisgurnus dabryanus]|uniref:equilibrative nucleoside transporter 4-like isoform X8 n=1 Tax=Paramisgurnus dabryanus TaxID=90735 RepID=UPI003CCF73D4
MSKIYLKYISADILPGMHSEDWSTNQPGQQRAVITNLSFNQLSEENRRQRKELRSPNGSKEFIPDDRNHGIYFAMLLAGVGFQLPYNSFITDVDYLRRKFTSIAGVIVSLSRIFTKLLVADEKNIIILFLFSVSIETLCFLLHVVVRRTRFVRYHTDRAQHSHTSFTGEIHDSPARNHVDNQRHYDSSAEEEDGTVVSSAVDDADGVHLDNSFHGDGTYVKFDVPKPDTRTTWISLKELLGRRCAVARRIWAHMLSITMTYFITLCLFPGLESELHNGILGEWLPILTMALFNMADFVGKILAACPYEWSGVQLLVCSCLRVLLLPLFMMCVSPIQHPLLTHPAWPCSLSLLLGVSNGYLGSVPMIQAAGHVPLQLREVAGNTMTVSYMAGLMLGSVVSYSTYSLTLKAHTVHTLKINDTLTLQRYMPGH